MGTNKRYPIRTHSWDPPWPPVQISDCEWIIIRDHPDTPAAIIRRFDATAERSSYFRVVTWRPTSSGRELVGRYGTFKEADRAVTFAAGSVVPPDRMWVRQRSTA
jgi:hypothetical protein